MPQEVALAPGSGYNWNLGATNKMSNPQRTRMGRFWRAARIAGGFVLLVLGVVGLFLPVLQGTAMIVAGLLLLAPEFPWARRLLLWAKRRFRRARERFSARTGKAAKRRSDTT